jgi:hypothetical protein
MIREDLTELGKYFFSLKMQGRLNPEIEKFFLKYKDLIEDASASGYSIFSIEKARSKASHHDVKDNDIRLKINLPLDLAKIRTLFEQKFFLRAQNSFKSVGTKLIKYKEQNFFLTKFHTVVTFSMVVSRSGDLEIFLIDCERHPLSDSTAETELDAICAYEPSSLERDFFSNICKVLNVDAIRDFFYSVFDLNLGNRLEYIKGEFTLYANQVMFRIWVKGIVGFNVLLDQKLNLIDLFSPNSIDSLKKSIVKLIKLQDSKLKLNLKKG